MRELNKIFYKALFLIIIVFSADAEVNQSSRESLKLK